MDMAESYNGAENKRDQISQLRCFHGVDFFWIPDWRMFVNVEQRSAFCWGSQSLPPQLEVQLLKTEYGAKRLQHITGLNYRTYWVANFLYDMVCIAYDVISAYNIGHYQNISAFKHMQVY